MSGKILSIIILLCATLAGGALFYFQVYGFYERLDASPENQVMILAADGTGARAVDVTDFQAIDAYSSPIRFRACFAVDPSVAQGDYIAADKAEPRNAPYWFDCFNAETIGAAVKSGAVKVFVGQKNIAYGVDRLVAIGPDGRGWIWHELNECGEKSYDGTVVGEACPDR